MATAAPSVTKTVMMIRLEKRIKNTHGPRRIGSSMRALRDEIARHSKVTPESVKISGDLNNYILTGSVQGFYGVKVALEKSSGIVKADLADKKKAPTATATPTKEAKPEKPKSLIDRLSQKTDAEKEAEKKASAPSATAPKTTTTPAASAVTEEKKAAQPKPSKETKPAGEKKQAPKKTEKKEEKKDEGSTTATSTGT